uniref:Uncharacterized protein n=1 Tax=Medicago truncatula TaxID=3880 RepID=B7FFV0_MEDTR|nr:unknown [Medicago truncatula]
MFVFKRVQKGIKIIHIMYFTYILNEQKKEVITRMTM